MLSVQEIIQQAKVNNGRVEGLVEVELGDMIGANLEEFLDLLEERLTGLVGYGLQEIDYKAVGIAGPVTIVMCVSGYYENDRLEEIEQEQL